MNNILVVKIYNDLDKNNSRNILPVVNKEVKSKDITELILDFSELDFIDNSGIGFITSTYNIMKNLEGTCKIANPPKYIKTALRLAGIDRICKIIDNTENLSADSVHYIIIENK